MTKVDTMNDAMIKKDFSSFALCIIYFFKKTSKLLFLIIIINEINRLNILSFLNKIYPVKSFATMPY